MKCPIVIDDPETVRVAVRAEASGELPFFHDPNHLGELLFRRLRRMSTEIHVAPIMENGDPSTGLLEKGVDVSAARPVENIRTDFEFGFLERGDVNNLFKARKISGASVECFYGSPAYARGG